MARLGRRTPPKSTRDKLVGRALEAVGRLTGNRKASAGGKGVRARGKTRAAAGRGVRRGRR